jgi:hypothetical protein
MRNDWEKSPNDRKEEAFHAPDETKARAKPKKSDKPFLVETRYKYVANRVFQFMMEWSGKRKFETLELAQTYAKKLSREAWSDRREIRITDLREGTEHAVD